MEITITPNQINKQVLKKYKKEKIDTIKLDIQSTNDYILKKSNNNFTFKDIKKASKLIKLYGFKLGYKMVLGLPESTRIDEINTAKNLIKLKPKKIDISLLTITKGTELEKEYNKGKYEPLSITQAIEICKEIVRMFYNKKIEITSIEADSKENIVAGPFHPEFKQLVESAMWYDAILNKIKKLNAKVKEVEITVNPEDVENIIGYKKENVIKLKDTYDVDLIVNQDEKMKKGKTKIEITKLYNS